MNPMPPSHDDSTVMPGRLAQGGSMGAAQGSNTLPVGTRLGEFEITGLVGEGGFGIVYLAYDHSLQRTIALKEYMPSALAARTGAMTVSVKSDRHAETFQAGLNSFINEARLLAQFDHPSLVKVYRFWEANGTAYMVMPFYEGVTLKECLRRLGEPPGENWLKDLLRPLFDALSIIHREQCFHRDVAPDNILILADGRPVLLDFGAARRVIGDMTQALTVILKPGYAPIEQYAEIPDFKQGAWTDIYALAAVVYFAITGKPPIPSVSRVMSDTLAPLGQSAAGRYSESFLRGIDMALAVKPADRPQTVAQLRALLGLGDRRQGSRAALSSIGEEMAPQPTTGKTPPIVTPRDAAQQAMSASPLQTIPKKRPTIRHAAVVLLAIALLGGTGAYLLLGHDEDRKPAIPPTATAPAVPAAAGTSGQPEPRPAIADASHSTMGASEEKPAQPDAKAAAVSPLPPVEKTYTPGLALDEVFEGRVPSHTVTVSLEKAQLRIKEDNFRFGITSSRPGYVYILMVGTNGSDFILLFPNREDTNNRIAANQQLVLPRSTWRLAAKGPAGINQFVALVSDERRDFNEIKPVSDQTFPRFDPERSAQLYRKHAGPQPLFSGRVACARQASCSQSYGAAKFSIEEIEGTGKIPGSAPAAAASRVGKLSDTAAAKPQRRATPAEADACSKILQRVSLGEPLTQQEQTLLRNDCK